jgi:type IV pilus biogenesis protein PilP
MAAKTLAALALLLLAAATPTFAATPTVADLDAVQAETLLTRAKAAQAKAAAELAEHRGARPTASAAMQADEPAPTARGLFGANGNRYVVFQYATGGIVEGKVGDSIPGGYRVVSFDSNGVTLAHRGRRERIPFSMHAPTPAPAAAPTQAAAPFVGQQTILQGPTPLLPPPADARPTTVPPLTR